MRVPHRCRGDPMSEQFADHLQGDAATCREGCVAVAEIVQPNVLEAEVLSRDDPCPAEILVWLVCFCTRDDETPDALYRLQHLESSIGQMDRARLVRLRVGQPNDLALPIDVRPFDRDELAGSRSREERQSQTGGGVGTDLAVALRALDRVGGLADLVLG